MLTTTSRPTISPEQIGARIVILQACLWLAGCATTPQSPVNPIRADWSLEGRLAVRSERGNYAASMRWEQRRNAYTINLVGPLGQGATLVRGDFDRIQIQRAGHRPVSSENVEELMQEQLGWSIPIEHAVSWVRGEPSPSAAVQINSVADDGLPSAFRQAGFAIRMERDGALPTRIELQRDEFRLVVQVRRWRDDSSVGQLSSRPSSN